MNERHKKSISWIAIWIAIYGVIAFLATVGVIYLCSMLSVNNDTVLSIVIVWVFLLVVFPFPAMRVLNHRENQLNADGDESVT